MGADKSPYKVHARLKDANRFKVIFEGLRDMVKEVTMDFDPDKRMTMQAMDDSRIVLISMVFEKAAFSRFSCVEDVSVAFNVHILNKLFHPCESGMEVDIFVGKKAKDVLSFEFMGAQDEISVGWCQLLNMESDHYEVPDLSNCPHLIVPSWEFLKTMRDFSTFNDEVRLHATEDMITFSIEGDGAATGQLSYHKNQKLKNKKEVIFNFEKGFDWSQKFNLKLMLSMAKVTNCDENTTLWMSKDTPFAIGADLGGPNCGRLTFFIASRVENEDY